MPDHLGRSGHVPAMRCHWVKRPELFCNDVDLTGTSGTAPALYRHETSAQKQYRPPLLVRTTTAI
jgi:hypothetical protein